MRRLIDKITNDPKYIENFAHDIYYFEDSRRVFETMQILAQQENDRVLQAELSEIEKKDPRYIPPVDYDKAMDLRGTPTHVCPCGSQVWLLKVTFVDYEISNYFLDMECLMCGSFATAPTPIDKANHEES